MARKPTLAELQARYKTPYAAARALGLDAAFNAKRTKSKDSALVGDSKERTTMTTKLSPAGFVTAGALTAYLTPRMAADAKLPDIKGILMGAPVTNRTSQNLGIVAALRTATTGKLAQDADLDDVQEVIEALSEPDVMQTIVDSTAADPTAAVPMTEPPEEKPAEAGGGGGGEDDGDMASKVLAFCEGKLAPEDCAQLQAILGTGGMDEDIDAMDAKMWGDRATAARDKLGRDETKEERGAREEKQGAADAKKRLGRDEREEETKERRAKDAKRRMGRDDPPPFKGVPEVGKGPTPISKAAMDAAIASALSADQKRVHGVYEAVAFVEPWVGKLPNAHAFDAAPAVYGRALEMLNVSTKDIHPSALRAVLEAQVKPGERRAPARQAHDSAANESFGKMFPTAGRIELR